MKRDLGNWQAIPYTMMVSLIAVAGFLYPYHNGDMPFYVANVIAIKESAGVDYVKLCQKADGLIKTSIPASHYAIVGRTCDEATSRAFAEALPWYSVKPLYILGIEALHYCRIPLVKATVLVSVISYLGLALLLWKWIGWPAYIVMIAPPVIANVRVEVPDELNLLIMMIALYLVCEKKRYVWGAAILLVCIWCRPDMIMLSGLCILALWVIKKLDFVEFATLSFLALASYFAITAYSGNYGWAVLFKNSFTVAGVRFPGEEIVHITPKFYIQIALDHLHSLEFQNVTPNEQVQSSLMLFILFAVLAVRVHKNRTYQVLTVATVCAIGVHCLAMPSLYPRWLSPMYLFLMVSFIVSLKRLTGNEPLREALAVKSGSVAVSKVYT